MKRVLLALVVAASLIGAVAFSSGSKRPGDIRTGSDLQVQVEDRNPWTHLRMNDAPDTFHFAVVSDRTGGRRARIFSQAVTQLNLLQPAFVISVGDLIEGYTKDEKKLADEWKEFQGYVSKLQMPFFYVPGNHDVSNPVQEKDWHGRFGRCWYHFVYKDVLFLMLSSDDPTPSKEGGLGKEQIAWVQKTLRENTQMRWTIVSLHRPLWNQENLAKNGWLEVERELNGRPYTVFAGHIHRYHKFVRNGMNYYQLATTGGSSRMRGLRYGEFDHIAWVTMKKDGPVVGNILLDGVLPEDLKLAASSEEAHPILNRKPTQPVTGKVFCEGAPAAEARIAFHVPDPKDAKKFIRGGDAIVDVDGSFTLSSYQAFDGAPVGDYMVTVQWREPWLDARGLPGPSLLPAKYARPETTPLRAQVKTGLNDITLNLTR